MSWQLHPDVAWVSDPEGDTVYVARLPEGRPVVLNGTAADLFVCVAAGSDPVAEAIAVWPERRDEVRADVETFLTSLEATGIVQRGRADDGGRHGC